MSRRTSFKARAVWVRPSVHSRTLKVHTLDSQPYPLVDAKSLFTCPRAPPSWYQVCSTQGTPVPTAFQMPIKETEELVCAAGRDLAVISELDWLTSGASHLLGQMAATPALSPYMSSITLLQRYALETCRSVEMLERSLTARYANHLWRVRDGHLSRLHLSVPKQTKESLRQAPLLGTHLFPGRNSGYCCSEPQRGRSTFEPLPSL